jgi:hypothetical protein
MTLQPRTPRPPGAQPVRLTNVKPSAKALGNKLQGLQANLQENQDLDVELHTPSGAVIRITHLWSYDDTDDTLLVQGTDEKSGDLCAGIVPVQTFYVVIRVKTVVDPAQKRRIGFHNIEDPEQATLQPPDA